MAAAKMAIVVTGASSGVGAALARQLAACGHTLYLTGRNEKALGEVATECTQLGAARVHTGAGDVGRPSDVDRIWSEWGSPAQVDVLCANAGLNAAAPIDGYSLDEYDAIFDTNVKGVWLWMRLVLPGMRLAGQGQIVVTSSVLGLRPPTGPGASLYTASKYAVQGLVASARAELAGTGIKVATVNPAAIATPWWSDPSRGGARESMPDTSGFLTPEMVALAITSIIFQHPLSDVDHVVIDNAKPLKAKATG